MDKKKFLVTMLAAIATALILVLLQRGPKTVPQGQPPVATPAKVQSLPDTSNVSSIRAGSCNPTECKFSPVISPALELASNGKPVIGIWNLARSSQTVLTLKNVSPETVTISALTLYTCLNDNVVPVDGIPEECRFIRITQSDYKGGELDLKPGESVSTTVEADTHGQVAKLQFDTTRGPIVLLVTVQ